MFSSASLLFCPSHLRVATEDVLNKGTFTLCRSGYFFFECDYVRNICNLDLNGEGFRAWKRTGLEKCNELFFIGRAPFDLMQCSNSYFILMFDGFWLEAF
jgi:hypothetical protein